MKASKVIKYLHATVGNDFQKVCCRLRLIMAVFRMLILKTKPKLLYHINFAQTKIAFE